MKIISRRIRKLEDRLSPDNGQQQRLWVAIHPGCQLALDFDRCVDILGECGFLPSTRFGVLNFCGIPDGLNAKELENYLRKNGAETCGFRGYQNHGGVSQAQMAPDGT
jgi:hypothetical protein